MRGTSTGSMGARDGRTRSEHQKVDGCDEDPNDAILDQGQVPDEPVRCMFERITRAQPPSGDETASSHGPFVAKRSSKRYTASSLELPLLVDLDVPSDQWATLRDYDHPRDVECVTFFDARLTLVLNRYAEATRCTVIGAA